MVLSYNVCGYGGNYKYEHAFDSIYNYVERIGPDILCLQEAQPAKQYDKGRNYCKLFPYNDTTRINDASQKMVNSVGIHSRFPIIRKELIDYESTSNGSVAYFLKRGSDTLIVVNNHLEHIHLTTKDRTDYKEILKKGMERDLSRDTMKMETRFLVDRLGEAMVIRAKQAEAVYHYLEQYRRFPIIVCGDFNDTPISYTRHVMSKGLTDCFAAAGNGLGLSFNTKGFNFRIDHMMVSDDFKPLKCEIDSKIDVSDHYPLLCWLKMVQKP
jgi:endonuclease/exonuclease/phosphatase family metal-dependent hydrolase